MCDCSCKIDTQKTPAVFGWIVVYELAIIITILLLIYLDKTDNAETPVVENVE